MAETEGNCGKLTETKYSICVGICVQDREFETNVYPKATALKGEMEASTMKGEMRTMAVESRVNRNCQSPEVESSLNPAH